MIGHPLQVSELIKEIQRGEILLPEIQRSYVWKGPQVAKLIDSLYHEYPVGQILLWDTIELLLTTKGLEGTTTPSLPNAGRPKIVLDGQQRLTSLFLALAKDGDESVDVYFNLETEQFQLYLRRLESDKRWISVRNVLNGTTSEMVILQKLAEDGVLTLADAKSQEYLNRIQKLKKINDYKFPIEIFKSDDYEEVTELFVRINSAGTRLRMAELALAQLALRLPGVIVEKFEKAIEEFEEKGFDLDARFLTRSLIVSGTNQSRFKSLAEFWKKPPKEIESIWKDTRKGIDLAVNFVRANAGFDTTDWLPSLNAVIVLAAYFKRYPRIANDVEDGLLRWFYLASLRGRYSGSGETAMDEDLKALNSDDPVSELIKNVSSMGKSFEVTSDEFDDAGWRNPLFALTYAVIRKNKANDWFTGIDLSRTALGEDNAIQIHHIFPKKYLKENGVGRRDRDEIANLAFLGARPNRQISAKAPEEYLAEIASKHPERLERQCVPLDPKLWRVENFQEFLAERRRLLAAAVNKLLIGSVKSFKK